MYQVSSATQSSRLAERKEAGPDSSMIKERLAAKRSTTRSWLIQSSTAALYSQAGSRLQAWAAAALPIWDRELWTRKSKSSSKNLFLVAWELYLCQTSSRTDFSPLKGFTQILWETQSWSHATGKEKSMSLLRAAILRNRLSQKMNMTLRRKRSWISSASDNI